MNKQKLLASFITLLAVLGFLSVLPTGKAATPNGTVCIAGPADLTAGSSGLCPTSIGSPISGTPIFNGPLTSPNTLIRVAVMINNSDPMIGYDITLKTSNVTVLRPFGVDTTGTILGSSTTTLLECIGTVRIAGSTCGPIDTSDTLRLSVIFLGGLTAPGTTGLLFTAIFSIGATSLPGGVTIGYQTGCSSNAESNGNNCVDISNGTLNPVPVNLLTAGFDNSNTTTFPYATLSTTTTSLGVFLAGQTPNNHGFNPATTTFTATAVNGFDTSPTPQLTLATSVNSTSSNKPVATLSTGSIDFSITPPPQTFTMTGSVSTLVPAGLYIVTTTAAYLSQDPSTLVTSSLAAALSLPLDIQDYTIAVSPGNTAANALQVAQGATGTATVTVTPLAGLNNPVKLGLTIPSATSAQGITGSLSTNVLSSGFGTSALTVSVPANAAVGSYTMTIVSNTTLNGFTRIHNIVFNLKVTASVAPDYAIFSNPNLVNMGLNVAGSSLVTIVPFQGFTGTVSLSDSISPSTGLTCLLTPPSVTLSATSQNSTLLCTGTISGTYTVTVTGTSGTLSHQTSVTFNVGTNDFSLVANPASITLTLSINGSSTVGASLITSVPTGSITGSVALTDTVSPATGLACSLTPASISVRYGNSTLACSGSIGSYVVTVTGTNGTITHSVTVAYTIIAGAPPDFALTAFPASVSATVNSPGVSTISVLSLNGFKGTVDLSASFSNPSGVICGVAPEFVTLNGSFATSVLTCTSTEAKSFSATVTGTNSSVFRSVNVGFTVTLGQCDPTNNHDNTANQCQVDVSINPSSVVDSAFTPGRNVSITVNLADPAGVNDTINGFAVEITYDYDVLNAVSITDSGNVLTAVGSPLINRYCLDGLAKTSFNGCQSDDAHGVASFSEVLLGQLTTSPTQGLLITLNLKVVGSGFTAIHIRLITFSPTHTDSATGLRFQIPTTTSDGLYSNIACGSSCLPPTVNFSWTPLTGIAGQTVTFDASSSRPGSNATITEYFWAWGDPSNPTPSDYCSYPDNSTNCFLQVHQPLSSAATHIFHIPGIWSVTLTVKDSNGLTGSATMIVSVVNPPIAGDFSFAVQPGQPIQVGQAESLQITLTSSANATGTVNLSMSLVLGPAGVGPGFFVSPNQVFLGASQTVFAFANISTSQSTVPGSYTFMITAASQFFQHSATVTVIILPPPAPDFSVQPEPVVQAIAGSPSFLGVAVPRQPSQCNFNSTPPPFNVTLTTTLIPTFPNGPRLVIEQNPVQVFCFEGFTTIEIFTTPTTPTGNYTIIVTGDSGHFVHSGNSTLQVFPPPVLTVTPTSGPVGTKVTVKGTGFILFNRGYGPFNRAFWMTFDNQFLGYAFTSSSSFTFVFNVPISQAGMHNVTALDLNSFSGLNATTVFQVTQAPSALAVSVNVGTLYFPGDTAVMYVLVTQNGSPVQSATLQLILITAGGSTVTLNSSNVSAGLYRAKYSIPTTGAILGTYAVMATVHTPDSSQGSALASFEVKPTWLQSNSSKITTATAAVAGIGLVAFAWHKGYFKKKEEDEG